MNFVMDLVEFGCRLRLEVVSPPMHNQHAKQSGPMETTCGVLLEEMQVLFLKFVQSGPMSFIKSGR